MSTLGHSGHSGHGGHAGGHSGCGHHGHSGGGHAMGGGGPQETWNAALNETRFSGELFRSPLIPLIAYGMVFISIVMVVCFADSNLFEFAMSQHKEAQEKHAAEVQKAIKDAEAASAGSTAEQAQIETPSAPTASVQPDGSQRSAFAESSGGQQPILSQTGFGQMGSAQPSVAQPSPVAQPGYLQQSLQPGFAQAGYGANQQPGYAAYPQPAYGQQSPSSPGFASAPVGPASYGAGAYQPSAYAAPPPNQYQQGGAWLQGGYKTGPDGVSRIPMNRMVVNR